MANPKAYWEKTVKGTGSDRELLQAADEAIPNPAHYALADLEEMGILKYLITQNIDNLDLTAGSTKVAEIHGNIKKVRCIKSNTRYGRTIFHRMKFRQNVQNAAGLLKPISSCSANRFPRCVTNLSARNRQIRLHADGGDSVLVYPGRIFHWKSNVTAAF